MMEVLTTEFHTFCKFNAGLRAGSIFLTTIFASELQKMGIFRCCMTKDLNRMIRNKV